MLTDQEVFIDCGGFDGDTSVKFIDKCGGKYANIVIFEPELYKKTAIEENMSDIVMSCIRQVYGAKPPDFTLMHWKQTVRMCQNQRVTM